MKIRIAGKNLTKLHCQIKKALYSNLNLGDISNEGYSDGQKVWVVF